MGSWEWEKDGGIGCLVYKMGQRGIQFTDPCRIASFPKMFSLREANFKANSRSFLLETTLLINPGTMSSSLLRHGQWLIHYDICDLDGAGSPPFKVGVVIESSGSTSGAGLRASCPGQSLLTEGNWTGSSQTECYITHEA